MKIAIIHPSMAIKGGAENVIMWLANGLIKKGHKVTIFTKEYNKHLWADEFSEKIEVIQLKKSKFMFINSKRIEIPRFARILSRKLRDFDLVSPHNFPSNLWVVRARRISKNFPKVIWYCQEPLRKVHWEITEKRLLNHTDYCNNPNYNQHIKEEVEGITKKAYWKRRRRKRDAKRDKDSVKDIDLALVNSKFSAQNFEKIYGVRPTVCYLGIPLNEISENIEKKNYFCAVSPLRNKKNIHNVIEAMNILVNKWRLKDINLKIAGSGGELKKMQEMISEYELQNNIEFLGLISDKELSSLYKGARLTIYIPLDEPFGLVPAESMACKTPVIASNHGGPTESVIDGKTGFLVNPFDPEEIAKAIKNLYYDEKKIKNMGEKGFEYVEENFHVEDFVDRFEKLAQSVIG